MQRLFPALWVVLFLVASPLHAEHGARRAPSDASFALNSSGRKTHGKIRVSSPRDVIRQAGSRYAFFKGFKKVRLSA